MAYGPKRAPKLPATSFMDSARDGSGRTISQARNAKKIAKIKAENASYSKMHAEGQAASKRARKAAAMGGSGKGIKHRAAGSPRGGQFY